MKTGEDFKKAAKEKNIERWDIHNCGFCNYPCGYVIQREKVYYDSGCNCTYTDGWQERTWEDIADQYNRNAGSPDVEERKKEYPAFAEVVKKDNELWGF